MHRSLSALAGVLIALSFVIGALSPAHARAGSGFSSGSRGSFTYSPPPSTPTAPFAVQPMQRSYSQPSSPSYAPSYAPAYGSRGLFGGPGGFGTGLLGGLLGAGLFGLMFGHGFFGGIGGGFSLFGLILQIFLFYWIAKFVIGLFFRRAVPLGPDLAMGTVGGSGFQQRGPEPHALAIGPEDYAAFERSMIAVQDAYSREDLEALRRIATPEMVSYFADDLAHNAGRGLVNRVSQVRLVKGDLSQAWTEGATDYATVAMRFSIIDLMIERATNRIVSGDPTHPEEVTEVWTFRRDSGGPWMLSAIQQTS